MDDASSKIDASLEDLPKLKADLEEARQLLDRLEDREEETDPERYERLAGRYEEQIEKLEPTVEQLTDQGETRKLELKDRLAHQRDRAREAKEELGEIESLYEEGAMAEEAYREDRRRFRRQKKEAESEISEIERELDEVEFYLTETGEVNYQKERLQGKAESILEEVSNHANKASNKLRGIWDRYIVSHSLWLWGSVVLLLALTTGYWLLGALLFSTDASTYRGGNQRTGVYKAPGPSSPFTTRWQFTPQKHLRGLPSATPTVANGTVYAGDNAGGMYAIDVKTEKKKWSFNFGDRMVSPPAVDNGLVFVSTYGGQLYSIDAVTGKKKWTFSTDGEIWSSPAVIGGSVYFGSKAGKVFAVTAESGRLKWQFPTNGKVVSSPAIASGTVYVGSGGGYLYAINAETGKQQWRVQSEGAVLATPAVSGETVYFGDKSGTLYAVNKNKGSVRWTATVGKPILASPAAHQERVVVRSSAPRVFAFNVESGLQEWSHRPTLSTLSDGFSDELTRMFRFYKSPVITRRAVYVSGGGRLTKLNLETGETISKMRVGAHVTSGLVPAGSTVVFRGFREIAGFDPPKWVDRRPEWAKPREADAGWRPEEKENGTGSALQSMEIGNGEEAVVEIDLPSTEKVRLLGFDYRVSSEDDYDYLNVYLDGRKILSASGEVSWTRTFETIHPTGKHTLRFVYDKDDSQHSGADRAWIDNVTLGRGSLFAIN